MIKCITKIIKSKCETILAKKTMGKTMKRSKKISYLVQGAAIAALYCVLTLISSLFGLSSGVIQLRISECLTVLPCFTPSAVPGLFVGCIISNIITGAAVWDVIFGSIATLIGALFTYLLRNHKRLVTIPPIVANTLIVPFILAYVYKREGSIWYFMLTVGIGEIISCGVFGTIFYNAACRYNLFKNLK